MSDRRIRLLCGKPATWLQTFGRAGQQRLAPAAPHAWSFLGQRPGRRVPWARHLVPWAGLEGPGAARAAARRFMGAAGALSATTGAARSPLPERVMAMMWGYQWGWGGWLMMTVMM